jgi:CAAX protease family protein
MVGIVVQLCISWLVVWLLERKNLSVLGFYPSKRHLIDFILFFCIAAACCSVGFLMKIYFSGQAWQLNPDLSARLILNGIWWNVKSVLFEELIFRGVLLYILIKRIGFLKGIIISSIAFGIYHWFSFGVFGSIVPMIVTFLMTATMGLLLAYGYSKTFSLYIPIAIHLGWNLTQTFIFSQGPIGHGLFISTTGNSFRTDSYFIFILVTFLPIVLVLLVSFLLIKNKYQAQVAVTN